MGRLRTNVDAPELIKEYKNYGDLKTYKFTKKPLYLEIGCGKGDFLINHALQNPKINYLGIEKFSTVILKALKKIKRNNLELNNLVFTCGDAATIDVDKFAKKVSKLYLNFSDPWPKKRHAKRRLTSDGFLDLYKKILKDEAQVEFKTDNDGLFAFTMETLQARKDIKIIYSTTDLHKELNKKINANNVETEYEKKFVALGKNINKVVFEFKK